MKKMNKMYEAPKAEVMEALKAVMMAAVQVPVKINNSYS